MAAVEWLEKELIKRFKRSQMHYTDSEWCFDMIKKLSEQAKELEIEKQDTLAIGFTEWLNEEYSHYHGDGEYYDHVENKWYKLDELLKIYKNK